MHSTGTIRTSDYLKRIGCGSFRTKYFRGFLKTGLVFRYVDR